MPIAPRLNNDVRPCSICAGKSGGLLTLRSVRLRTILLLSTVPASARCRNLPWLIMICKQSHVSPLDFPAQSRCAGWADIAAFIVDSWAERSLSEEWAIGEGGGVTLQFCKSQQPGRPLTAVINKREDLLPLGAFLFPHPLDLRRSLTIRRIRRYLNDRQQHGHPALLHP